MLLDKLVEIGSQYLARQPAGPRIDRDLRHLQQQALLEIAGAYAGGFQFMDDAEQFLQLLGRVSIPTVKAMSSATDSRSRRR